MPAPACRRIGLIDAMALVAATAVGIAPISGMLNADVLTVIRRVYGQTDWSPRQAMHTSRELLAVTFPCFAAWTLVLPILRLRRPRPSARRLARQPGLVACGAATLAMVAAAAEVGVAWAHLQTFGPTPGIDRLLMHYPMVTAPQVGVAVAAAWAGLYLSRSWRSEPSWIDRVGRILGLYWIGVILPLGWYIFVRLLY